MARAPKPLDHRSFLRGLAKHKPALVYLLLGDEPFFRRRVVDALRARILGPDAPAADVRRFTGKRKGGDAVTELSAVLDAARTVSMFDPVRLIHVEEAGALLGKEAGEVILPYLENPAPDAHLVLECESVDGRTKVGKALKQRAAVIECPKLYDRPAPWETDAAPWEHPLATWLVGEAADHGLEIGQKTAHILAQRVGSEPGLLAAECGRLASILHVEPTDRRKVSEDDIERFVPDTRGESLFRLGDAISARDTKAALKVIDSLFREGVPEKSGAKTRAPNAIAIRTLSWVVRTLREVWVARDLRDPGKVARVLGKNPVLAEALCRNARKFKGFDFPALWPRLRDADVGLKLGAPPRLTVEEMVIRACGVSS